MQEKVRNFAFKLGNFGKNGLESSDFITYTDSSLRNDNKSHDFVLALTQIWASSETALKNLDFLTDTNMMLGNVSSSNTFFYVLNLGGRLNVN